MLKPFWLFTVTTTGDEVWQLSPTGTLRPATDKLTILSVILEVVVTAPVFRFSFPVVGAALMNRVVAVTGITPNCRKDPVASGSVRVAFRLPVLGFRSAA